MVGMSNTSLSVQPAVAPAPAPHDEHRGMLKRHLGAFSGWKSFQYIKRGIYLEEYKIGQDPSRSRPTMVVDISHATIVEQPGKTAFSVLLGGTSIEVMLMAATVEEKTSWLHALARGPAMLEQPCAAALIAPVRRRHVSSKQSSLRTRREEKKRDEPYRVHVSLRVNIMEADRLSASPKAKLSPYCVVAVDGQQRSVSTIKKNNNKPFWAEEFFYDTQLTHTAKSLVIVINNGNSPRDPRLGQVTIDLQSLLPGHTTDAWYPIVPLQGSKKPKKNPGTMRIKITFTLEQILPYSEYADLLELIMDSELTVAKSLARVCSSQLDEVAGTLVNIFALNNRVNDFVRTLATVEIQKTDVGAIMFRGNTLSTKVVDIYMKMVGLDYLKDVLSHFVHEVINDPNSCEIDTARLSKGEDLAKNQQRLQDYVSTAFRLIANSVDQCPEELRLVFANIRMVVMAKFHVGVEQYTAVSGFIFLRFFCPAILNPSMFGITQHVAVGEAARSLTLIAKTLQNMANLVAFNSKEPYMKPMEPYLESALPEMEECIRQFSTPSPNAVRPADPLDRRDLSREMAAMERHFCDHRDPLLLLAEKEPNTKLSRLFEVLDHLAQRIKFYERNPTAMPPNEVYDRMKRVSRLLDTDLHDVTEDAEY